MSVGARLGLFLCLPRLGVVAVAVGQQPVADPLNQAGEAGPIAGLQALAELRHQPRPGIAAEILDRSHVGQELLRLLPHRLCVSLGNPDQILSNAVKRSPAIQTSLCC